MIFSAVDQFKKRKEADLIVLPFWESRKKKQPAKPAAAFGSFESFIEPVLESGDFSGAQGQLQLIYLKDQKEKRCLMVGLGKEEALT